MPDILTTTTDSKTNNMIILGIPLFLAVLFAAITISMALTILLEFITRQTHSTESVSVTLITFGGSISFFTIAHYIRLTLIEQNTVNKNTPQ